MQRIVPLFFLVLAGSSLAAQEQNNEKSARYFNQTELGIGFGVGKFNTDITPQGQYTVKNNEVPISLQTINGFIFNERIGAGLGLGVEMWKDGLFFPLFGQLTYYFKAEEKGFFVSGNIGYGFGTRDSTSIYHAGTGALTAGVSLGYRMKVAKRLQFMYEFYYKYQAIQSSYSIYYSDSTRQDALIDYKVPMNFLGFRIGVIFK
jgi:hypothetical protein